MRFEVIDRISIPSPTAALNEDAVGARDNAAWVVDGATGVSDLPPLVSSQSDAAWLAAQLDNEFDHAFQTSPVEPFGALAEINADIRAQFIRTNKLPERTAVEQPTAAFALSVVAADTATPVASAPAVATALSTAPYLIPFYFTRARLACVRPLSPSWLSARDTASARANSVGGISGISKASGNIRSRFAKTRSGL